MHTISDSQIGVCAVSSLPLHCLAPVKQSQGERAGFQRG